MQGHSSLHPDVLLCGFRRGLAKALEDQGFSYVILEKEPFKYKSSFLLDKFMLSNDLQSMVDTLTRKYQGTPLRAVIAAKEWAVLPAAKIRNALKLPGSSIETANVCTNKFEMKERARDQNIPITPYALLKGANLEQLKASWGLPMVAKPIRSSGSRGLFYIYDLNHKMPTDCWPDLILEKYIEGEELSLESFVINGEVEFSNLTQYYEKGHINILPAQRDVAAYPALRDLNARVIKAMGIQNGLTHAEYYLGPQGPLLGEIAIRPPGGYIMEALSLAYGFDAWQAMLKAELGDLAGLRKILKPDILQFVAMHVIHPGAGRVVAIEGYDRLLAEELAFRVQLKLKVGQKLTIREGMGSDYGVVIQRSTSSSGLREKIRELQKRCKIVLAIK